MQTSFAPVSQLFERWRPASFADVIGQEKAKRTLETIRQRNGGLFGRAYWISGKSGMGKTTFAKLIAADGADDWATEEWDAGTLTVSDLQAVERCWDMRGLGKGGRAYIVNESHGLRKPVIRQLLVMLERIPSHVVIVFTTTLDGQESLFEDCDDASPLLSRCTKIQLESRGQNELIAKRLCESIEAEGLGKADAKAMLRVVNDERGNIRAVIGRIENGEFIE